ncbi:MAG: hypothetical protein H6525_03420 [Actinobacteria bacterium]|nr:hypothetical protein [Actinomycetota bacterium]
MGVSKRISKEAVALGAAALLVGGSLLVGQQAMKSEGAPAVSPTSAAPSARDTRSNTVVAVNSESPASAAAAWNATALRTLPGSVVIVPPSSSTQCPDVEAEAARAAAAIERTVVCSATDPFRLANAHASLRHSINVTQGRVGSLVLLGEGWTEQPPVPLPEAQWGDPMAVAIAVQYAENSGTLPDMSGIDVVIAGPPPTPELRTFWDAYFEAAGASTVEWATSWAAASEMPSSGPSAG